MLLVVANSNDDNIFLSDRYYHYGKVPDEFGGKGPFRIRFCLECGQVQGKFPIEQLKMEVQC